MTPRCTSAHPGGKPRRCYSYRPSHPWPGIHITDIEAAINRWRARSLSSTASALSTEVRALAEVYGSMVWQHERVDEICSTAAHATPGWPGTAADAGHALHRDLLHQPGRRRSRKGHCGRSFDEVQGLDGDEPRPKRATRRITMEGTAWRFNRYAERGADEAAA